MIHCEVFLNLLFLSASATGHSFKPFPTAARAGLFWFLIVNWGLYVICSLQSWGCKKTADCASSESNSSGWEYIQPLSKVKLCYKCHLLKRGTCQLEPRWYLCPLNDKVWKYSPCKKQSFLLKVGLIGISVWSFWARKIHYWLYTQIGW